MDYYVLTPISFVLRIFEAFSQFGLILILLNNRIFNLKHLMGSVIFAIIFETGKLIIPKYLSGFVALVLGIPFVVLFFKQKFIKVCLAYMFVGILIGTIDYTVALSIAYICDLEEIGLITKDSGLYTIGCIVMSLSLLIIAIVVKKIKSNRFLLNLNRISSTSLINILVTFILLIPNLVMLLYYHDGKDIPILLIVINILAIVAMFFVSTYNTRKSFELATTEQELITARTYNKTLQNLVDGLRTFKHDYNNTLQTMYGYIQLENMTGLKNFFDQILDESKAITALDKLKPELFKNPSLFGLVTAKYQYSRQNNVTMNFEIYGELDDITMQIYDFTRILGIFLDNAIEAATGSEKKKVNFFVSERKGLLNIEISNTYSDTGLKVEDMETKGVSSKGENRGLGLYKVKEILSKYPDIKHETIASNGMFMQKLVISKVKTKV